MNIFNRFVGSAMLTLALAFTVGFAPEFCFANSATAKYNGTSTRFAVMVGDTLHFKAAVSTAEQLQVKKNKYKFEIVVVGELAKALVEDKELAAEIDKADGLGVKIVVCEAALTYFNVTKEKLDKRLATTPNSWIYMFELKDQKYNTLAI